MKKIIAFTAALLAFLSIAYVGRQTVLASSSDDMAVAYVSVPDDWENPCLWAWDDEGNNAFSAWPGGEAEPDPNNEGWYYCYIPNWVTNVIVNANDGTIQTDGLVLEGGDIWVTVTSPEQAEVSYDALTTGEAPEYVEKITIYAKVPTSWESPCLWAWLDPGGKNAFDAWPGSEMKGSSGEWYAIKAPSWINCVIINGNGGSVQSAENKEIEYGKDIWVVVGDDLSAELYYENPDLMVPDITIRVKVPSTWEGPRIWAWLHPDGTNVYASWPGEELILNGDWYEITLPGWANSFIINGNGGSVQTGDMKELETGKDIWIVVTDSSTYEYDYVELASSPVAPTPTTASTPTPTPAEAPKSKSGGNTILRIIIGVVGVGGITTAAFFIIKKKKAGEK